MTLRPELARALADLVRATYAGHLAAAGGRAGRRDGSERGRARAHQIENNKVVNSLRAAVERAIAHVKTWKVPHWTVPDLVDTRS